MRGSVPSRAPARRTAALLISLSLGLGACSGGYDGAVAFSGEAKPEAALTSMVQILQADPEGRFSTLLGLVAAHDASSDIKAEDKLLPVLQSPGPLTLFAPTNDAFDGVNLASIGVDAEKADDGSTEYTLTDDGADLHAVLAAHVVTKDVTFATPAYVVDGKVDGRVELDDYGLVIVDSGSETVTSVGGRSLRVETGKVSVGASSADITEADIQAPNGFIQIIDEVLEP